MNTRAKIGILGWSQGENSFGVTKAYLHYFGFFGIVRILTPTDTIDEDLDLVVMPGGKDTLPTNYGEVPGYYNSDPDAFKEHFMKVNLPQYINARIPVFGICLGFQMIAVHFGAKLVQNLNLGVHGHSDVDNKGRGDLVNDLIFTPNYVTLETKLLVNKKNKRLKVCSLHHQGVDKDRVPEVLDVIAHTSDGVVEAFRHVELPVAGVQFHPEEDNSALAKTMIKNLIIQSPNFKNENKGNTVSTKS